jgi:hypothetical protein
VILQMSVSLKSANTLDTVYYFYDVFFNDPATLQR